MAFAIYANWNGEALGLARGWMVAMRHENINGVVFETRKIAAKNAHNGRVTFYVNGQAVSAAVFALDRAAAQLGVWEAVKPTPHRAVRPQSLAREGYERAWRDKGSV